MSSAWQAVVSSGGADNRTDFLESTFPEEKYLAVVVPGKPAKQIFGPLGASRPSRRRRGQLLLGPQPASDNSPNSKLRGLEVECAMATQSFLRVEGYAQSHSVLI